MIVLSIGMSLLGRGVFLGVDLLKEFEPWAATTPAGFVYQHGPIHDTIDAGAPAHQTFRSRLLDDHEFALWDPYTAGGQPLASTPGPGVLGPLDLPNIILGVRVGAAWSALLRLMVTALAMFFLLRRLRLSALAAWCGAIAWCTCSFFVAWNNWPQANVAAWLPLLFLVADRVVERRRARDVAALGAVFAAMLLEGYPPLVVITMYVLVPFVVIRWWDAGSGARAERAAGASSTPAPDAPVRATVDGESDDIDDIDVVADEAAPWVRPRARQRLAEWRDALRSSGALAMAGLLGGALAAIQIVPFVLALGNYDLSYRLTESLRHPLFASLITSVAPDMLGSPAANNVVGGNYVEQLGYVGAATVVLMIWALVRGRPRQISPSFYRYCVLGTVVLTAVVYFGGPVHNAVTKLPGMKLIPVTRDRMPLDFFVAILCAFGVEHVVASARRAARPARLWRVLVITLVGAVLAVASVKRALRLDQTAGIRRYAVAHSIAPAIIAGLTIVCIVAVARRHRLVKVVAFALPVLLAVESLLLTMTVWPRNVASADFYPVTPTHAFLQAHIGHERYAAYGGTMFPSTNGFYKLRSVSGHAFSPPAWRDLTTAGSPTTPPSPTLQLLARGLSVLTAPAFDRLAARYYVDVADAPPYGAVVAAPNPVADAAIKPSTTVTGQLPGGPLRAVGFWVDGPVHLASKRAYLVATIRDTAGHVVAQGSRRFVDQPGTRYYTVAIAGEGLAAGAPWQVTIGLRADRPDVTHIGIGPNGDAVLGSVRPQADGLRLVFADPGSTIYQRLHALARVRWAAHTVVVTSSARRVRLLAHGMPADTAILNQPGPAASGAPAHIAIRKDNGDDLIADVTAAGSGYVVVADAIQAGWSATVDGHAAQLVDADHALVAVAVSPGHHVVELQATPRGWHLGILVTLCAIVVALGLVFVPVVRRRRSRAASPTVAVGPGE